MGKEAGFYWERHAEAEKVCLDILYDCIRENAAIEQFNAKLIQQTSSRMLDWVDHLLLRDSKPTREKLSDCGFVKQTDTEHNAFYHPGALLPRILLTEDSGSSGAGVALRVDSIADFLQFNGFIAEIEGGPTGIYRRAEVSKESGVTFLVVERMGSTDYEPVYPKDASLRAYLDGVEACQNRRRLGEYEDQIFVEIYRMADNLITNLGTDITAHIFCRAERGYWLSRNFAAQLQKSRQDALGLGWGNQDHLTFRSSRRNFSKLVEFFNRLGFKNRERFYAGAEAGWGAQVMEKPMSGLTLFLDVDLKPEEVGTDFSREELESRDQLGTVGLWCALHGDSILQAGMHHVAARFDFERLINDIARYGVKYMAPFSNFPYLKQAFSVAERWHADPARVETLVKQKAITSEQADRFLSQGAVGSHLENIERREGYKGFNRKNVSAIILETDPRRHLA
jgi:4-hydroxyphenylpyruvate dioxygenase-like putative hemolysin